MGERKGHNQANSRGYGIAGGVKSMFDPRIIKELRGTLGKDRVLDTDVDRVAYSYDATWGEALPGVVVLPQTTGEVSATLKVANRERIPVVPRGAASGLSGGAVPLEGSICLSLTRMNKILEINPDELIAIVQPGVVNMDLQDAVAKLGLFFPPDPASWYMSTLGGNAAENAGGPRCLKYGVTKDYVLGLEVVLADGRVMRTGGRTIKNVAGYDLTSLIVGSEGTLGVVTEITVKLLPRLPGRTTIMGIFSEIDQACEAVNRVITSGVLPLTTEIMDGDCITAVQRQKDHGLPNDADAVLLIDVEGWPDAMAHESQIVGDACRSAGAREVRCASDEAECERLWAARRSISASLSTLGDKLGEDIAVPRSKIPAMVRRIRDIGKRYGLRTPVFGHIGDGNLHPYLICDRANREMMGQVRQAAAEIFTAAIELGGTLTGEHGIGLAKRDYLDRALNPEAKRQMLAVKRLFDPNNILNPGKLFAETEI
jgi:glycolate dehydrogenase FAD-linked subunit